MGRPPFPRAAAVLAAALLVAACGDDDTTTATAADPAVEETTTTTSTTEGTDGHGHDEGAQDGEPEDLPADSPIPAGADQVIEVAVTGDAVENGGRHEVSVGDTVALVITSDVDDEIHVHGYELYADIGPSGPVTVLIEATMPGVWEVELHDSGLALLELAVS